MEKSVFVISLFLCLGSALFAGTEGYYSGNGGRGMSLAILVPTGRNLMADQEKYLCVMVQGVLVADFTKYSAISVLDRLNLEKVLRETESGAYRNETAFVQLGRIANVSHILTGSITKTTSGFALQMQVTDTATGVTKASYTGTCYIEELDDFTGIRRASWELLYQLGVVMTDKAVDELIEASSAEYVNAQTALAQGITAQRAGTVVEALSYYFQATGYDPSLVEAASRVNIVTADITSGIIGQNARNDIQWRKDWVARLTECEQFFANYIKDNALYWLMYSTDLQQGNINYTNETLTISTKVVLAPQSRQWFETLGKVVETVRQGLEATGRASTWGLDWPKTPVSGQGMAGERKSTLNVVMELKDERGRILGRQTLALQYGLTCSQDRTQRMFMAAPLRDYLVTVNFNGIKAADITNRLSIGVTSIDGMSAIQAARAKHISAATEDSLKKAGIYSNLI